MKTNKRFFLTVGVFVIFLGVICGGLKDGTAASPEAKLISPEIANPDVSQLMTSMSIQQLAEPSAPPDFNLSSIAEEQINLRQYRGNVVLLSFWATW